MASNPNRATDRYPDQSPTPTRDTPRLVYASSGTAHIIPAPPFAPTQSTFPAASASNTASTQQWQAFATGGVQQNDQLRGQNNDLRTQAVSLEQQLHFSRQLVATLEGQVTNLQTQVTNLQTQVTNLQTQVTNQERIINGQANIIRQDPSLQQQAAMVQRNANLEELIQEREERVRQLDKQVWQITEKGKPWKDQPCSLCGRFGSMGRVRSERQHEGVEDKGNETRKGKAKDRVENRKYQDEDAGDDKKSDEMIGRGG